MLVSRGFFTDMLILLLCIALGACSSLLCQTSTQRSCLRSFAQSQLPVVHHLQPDAGCFNGANVSISWLLPDVNTTYRVYGTSVVPWFTSTPVALFTVSITGTQFMATVNTSNTFSKLNSVSFFSSVWFCLDQLAFNGFFLEVNSGPSSAVFTQAAVDPSSTLGPSPGGFNASASALYINMAGLFAVTVF
jgi:hypothetical protein